MIIEQHKLTLTNQNIDLISDKVASALEHLHKDHKEALKTRLLVEDALVDWQSEFGQSQEVVFTQGRQLGDSILSITLDGRKCDPFEDINTAYSEMERTLLSDAETTPLYSYVNGRNAIEFYFHPAHHSPIKALFKTVVIALIAALIGYFLFPSHIEMLADELIYPLVHTYVRLLTLISMPMIFLSILWYTLEFLNGSAFNNSNVQTIKGFCSGMLLAAIPVSLIIILFFEFHLPEFILFPGMEDVFFMLEELQELLIPSNILSPLFDQNIIAISFLAIALGIITLRLGKKAQGVRPVVETTHSILDFFVQKVGLLEGPSAVLLLIAVFWLGILHEYSGILWMLLIFFAITVVILLFAMCLVCIKYKVKPAVLFSKLWPLYCQSLKTPSVDHMAPECQNVCSQSLGISKDQAAIGTKLGLILCKLDVFIAFSIVFTYCSFFPCEGSDIGYNFVYMAISLLIIMLVSLVTPNYIGGTIIGYSVIFHHFGLMDMFAIAEFIDLFFNLYGVAVKMTLIPMIMIFNADKNQKLDIEKLRKPLKEA